MGPIGGRYSINAVQLTDSPFVVLNMRLLTRVSSSIWDAMGNADFVRCVHSMGRARPITVVNKYNSSVHSICFLRCRPSVSPHRVKSNEVKHYRLIQCNYFMQDSFYSIALYHCFFLVTIHFSSVGLWHQICYNLF
ncbi:unnamed protein product [Angiostrongylus costaricensis]|uniref:PEPCK_N domain-containing protein n=1 Tax=Angiostrongylus costaricensis TaxID=334426 RepID=A0A0R3P9Z3_ANGCS|nr:unnamed protein product [Angiostrongylus costaricensis]